MSKQLKDKAIDIHGKDYVMVKDRIIYFNDKYDNGSIITKILKSEGNRIVIKAKVTPDIDNPERYFTGISASDPSKSIEKQNPHEVAETSAVGRALAMMGIGVIDSVASADEMRKAGADKPLKATPKQINAIYKIAKHHKIELKDLAKKVGIKNKSEFENMTREQAQKCFDYFDSLEK